MVTVVVSDEGRYLLVSFAAGAVQNQRKESTLNQWSS